MEINFHNIELKISAGFISQVPKDNQPQILFSGRSNVGKSTLINALLNRKSLARVSAAPGKTITINFYEIDKKIYFVDLPGYGYAKRSETDRAKWSQLVDSYLNENMFTLIVQIIDMKTGPSNDDLLMLDWMRRTDKPYIIIATKADKLNTTERKLMLEELKKYSERIIPFSALNGEGKSEIFKTILKYCGGN
ncbi:MAG: ribosome biogenesis GTP-binding protein YihA/YsxC [Oscillospiraceae bacterium]|nr:ribosome biogenesis GTP-binding protein YihA/YsxC [Oscillospiraceae bacterium]